MVLPQVHSPSTSMDGPAPGEGAKQVGGEPAGSLETSKSQPEHTGCSACLAPVGNVGGLGRSNKVWSQEMLEMLYFI